MDFISLMVLLKTLPQSNTWGTKTYRAALAPQTPWSSTYSTGLKEWKLLLQTQMTCTCGPCGVRFIPPRTSCTDLTSPLCVCVCVMVLMVLFMCTIEDTRRRRQSSSSITGPQECHWSVQLCSIDESLVADSRWQLGFPGSDSSVNLWRMRECFSNLNGHFAGFEMPPSSNEINHIFCLTEREVVGRMNQSMRPISKFIAAHSCVRGDVLEFVTL